MVACALAHLTAEHDSRGIARGASTKKSAVNAALKCSFQCGSYAEIVAL
jgi:hypothetical protein